MVEIRRHTIYLSDRELMLVERMARAYIAVMRIQTEAPSKVEADNTARVCAVVQGHRRCTCPHPDIPVSEREVI